EVSWEAAVGQVEQRRSLSLLDRGTAGWSRVPVSIGPSGDLHGSEASPDSMQATISGTRTGRIRDSDNLLTTALLPYRCPGSPRVLRAHLPRACAHCSVRPASCSSSSSGLSALITVL